ncbi:MAG: RDD family protein [Actinomycetales bacterium]|nr:RDD family protein [Actinomycetales bacterium]
MVSRRDLGSWLSGATWSAGEPAPAWRGERLGAPAAGPGAMAGYGPRLLALGCDWAACLLIASALAPGAVLGDPDSGLLTLLIFIAEVTVLTAVAGGSFGQLLVGLRVVRVQPSGVTTVAADPARALLRTLLLAIVLPAIIVDADGRGLHDRFAGTALVRRR